MKKVKRILAIIGIIILVGLYVSTLIFAAIGSEDAMDWFRASVYSTVVLPVLIWAYGFVYRLLKNHYSVQENVENISDTEEEDVSETASEGAGNESNDNN